MVAVFCCCLDFAGGCSSLQQFWHRGDVPCSWQDSHELDLALPNFFSSSQDFFQPHPSSSGVLCLPQHTGIACTEVKFHFSSAFGHIDLLRNEQDCAVRSARFWDPSLDYPKPGWTGFEHPGLVGGGMS